MRYLSSISLALIVLMALACSSEPVATPTPDVPKYTDSQVLQVLENYARNTTHPSYFNNCWREGMKDLEYAVGRRTSDSNAFDVTGKGKFVDGTTYTMTWVVRMETNTSTYKHTGSGFVTKPAGQVTRTHVLTHC
jgi:hypothetical protein